MARGEALVPHLGDLVVVFRMLGRGGLPSSMVFGIQRIKNDLIGKFKLICRYTVL
jgi:hypothetical protein